MLSKTILKLFFIVCLIVGVERLCHKATDGFALVNIYSPQKTPQIATPEPTSSLDSFLNQPYFFLDSGSQSYVFLSADGQTVLKFFKFQHMRIPPWIDFLPLPQFLSEKREAKRQKKQAVLIRTLESYRIAYEDLKEESGLIFVHLSPTKSLNKSLTIYDKIGKKHELDLDQVEFVLQKRATLVYDTLNQWMAHDHREKAEKGLHDLLHLACQRCKKGLFDKDPDFSTNFGFVNDTPIQIDVGRISRSRSEKLPEVYQPEMIRITRKFQEWIEINHPDLLECFDKEIDSM